MPDQRAHLPLFLLPLVIALSLLEIVLAVSLAGSISYYIIERMTVFTQDCLYPNQLDGVGDVSRLTNVDRGLIAFWLPVVVGLVSRVLVMWERQVG